MFHQTRLYNPLGKRHFSEDVDWLVRKVIGLSVFDDENHVMNRSIMDINGGDFWSSASSPYSPATRKETADSEQPSTKISVRSYEEFYCKKLSEMRSESQ